MISAKKDAYLFRLTPSRILTVRPAPVRLPKWLGFSGTLLGVNPAPASPSPPGPDTNPGDIDIRIVDPTVSGSNRPSDTWIAEQASAVLANAMAPDQRDDRFANWVAPDEFLAAVAMIGEHPIGYLGGGIDRERQQLDGLIVESWASGVNGPMLMAALFHALEPSLRRTNATSVELWGKPAQSWHRSLADREGFSEVRALHQLRCALPLAAGVVGANTIVTRGFVLGQDEERLLTVNNRAFASHPDQGAMTEADLAEAASQPWFQADGIRLLEDAENPSVLAGFCWTKIHQPLAEGQPALGEIYAIAIDPDHHGTGLGKPMTAAGLDWLFAQGITTGMLYVEADNEPALATYYKLGFEQHRTDRAWRKRVKR